MTLDNLLDLIPIVGAFVVGSMPSILMLLKYRDTAKRDALAAANNQIGLQGESISKLEKRLGERDDHIDRLESEVGELKRITATLESERSSLKLTLDIALHYIQRLRAIMEECQIAVPPIPPELAEKIN